MADLNPDDPDVYVPEADDLFDFVKTPVSESPYRQAMDSVNGAVVSLIDSINATIASMQAETHNFSQETNNYELEALIDPVDFVISGQTFNASDVSLVERAFDGSVPDFNEPSIYVPDPPPWVPPNIDISIPPAPNLDIPSLSAVAPSIETPSLPERPVTTLPPMPEISAITIPAPPTYDIPDFEGDMPVFDMTPPSGELDWAESNYDSQLKTQLDGRLTEEVSGDTSGLRSAYEESIYSRARLRQESEHARALGEGLNYFDSRGIQLPGPALASIQIEVLNRIDQVRTDLENDIDVQEAKLVDENQRFVKDASTGWEKELIAYHDKAQDRALAAAKAVIEIMIAVYRAKVEGYKAQMSAYSSMADAYQSRVNAELGKAEFYKAQIEGKKMAVTAQSAMIEAYTAQVESVFTIADIYATEMEAARIQAEIDKIKMEAYAAKVKAYRYEVEATAAQYQIYIAKIRGEEAKVKMYESLVAAYTAEVEGHVARARVLMARLRVHTENIKAQAERYAAQVRKFVADTKKTVGLAEVRVISQGADNTNYDANQRPQLARMAARGQIAVSSATERAALETATARIQGATAKMRGNMERIRSRWEANKTKNDARRRAAQIATLSKSTNISDTWVDDTIEHSGERSGGVNRFTGGIRIGHYHRTKH